MKKALTLSLIIPVFNEEYALKNCLDSVKYQTVMPDEVIVVDNNSSDNTVSIAKKYPFVKVITEKKQGTLHARTKGFNEAKFDIIGRIDADTILEKNWVEIAKLIMQDSHVAAVTGSTHFYDMPLSPWNHWVEDFFKNILYKHQKGFPFLFGTNMAIRKDIWDQIKSSLCEDKYIYEDADLAIHLYKKSLKISYNINLRAGMSARRYSDKPKDFYRYIRLQRLTYTKHNIKTAGSYFAMTIYIVGYFILRPLALSYDTNTKKFSLSKLLFNRNSPRPQPFVKE